MRDKPIYPTTVVHSPDYYLKTLLALLEGVEANLSHAGIAHLLNSRQIRSATGKTWTAVQIKETLRRLRNPIDYPSRLRQMLMELIVQGKLTLAQATPIITRRCL